MTATIHRRHHRDWNLDTPHRIGDWRDHAACTHYPPDWWDLIGHTLTEHNRAAREICRACPVQTPCDQFATATHATGVILAGHSRPRRPRRRLTGNDHPGGADA